MPAFGWYRFTAESLVSDKGAFALGQSGTTSGLPAGEYKVTVNPRDYQELANSNSKQIPKPFRSVDETPLRQTVEEKDNTFDIVLK